MFQRSKKITIITSLYRGEKYIHDFLNHLQKINNADECELVLVHNDPTPGEEAIIAQFKDLKVELNHLKVPREGLYASWNRGIKEAKGKYVTIWNIDDVRLPDSIIQQAASLDNYPTDVMCIGNYIVVNEYGKTDGKLISVPEFDDANKASFTKRHHGGSFIMWRKEIHNKVGYFDEQFRLVGDLDFQIRVAKLFTVKKVDEVLGYFLAGTPDNLSSNYRLQDAENTAIHLRYGNYDLINIPNISDARKKVSIKSYKWFGENIIVDEVFTKSGNNPFKGLSILIALYKLPRHFARKYLKK